MATIHRPRRGSLAFSPRKRAKSEVPRIRSWVADERAGMAGFAGYKAGMTHVIMIDDRPRSLTEGMEISVPVTVVEVPPMSVAALRVYEPYNGGIRPAGELWAENLSQDLARAMTIPKARRGTSLEDIESRVDELCEIRVLAHTNPGLVTGIPKKVPEIMEIPVTGRSVEEQLKAAEGLLGGQVTVGSIFSVGDWIDVTAVTKGKGTQGPVKRWGIMLQKRKHSRTGKLRHVGNLGPWHPARISWRVPQLGQTGYHQRTEFNKRIIAIGTNGTDITPDGGFVGYGVVRNEYMLIKGSIPGPVKRLVRMRRATRPGAAFAPKAPQILYVSRESKQGV
ncbi:50S ribosomal protein L3 [Methanothrix sp.]|uniref:50S ribosomal protein L3 n=1 Tax=Methanothrix sp. TaxID=90426 RepID=UPI00257DBBC1|nr:50S ribosomal protein L3 [Methanothrix sp.]NPU88178.1 50S ribosomal protein L3 [Methanothrix sp.]